MYMYACARDHGMVHVRMPTDNDLIEITEIKLVIGHVSQSTFSRTVRFNTLESRNRISETATPGNIFLH